MRVSVFPFSSESVVLLSETFVTAIVFAFIVSSMLFDTVDPSAAVAVIVTLPADFAVTRPFVSTVAISVSLDDQVTFLLSAAEGVTVAVIVSLSPSTS